MRRVRVELAPDRDRCGALSLLDEQGDIVAGPFPVAARSTERLAIVRNNRLRNPLYRFGDTPTGRYRIAATEIDESRYPNCEFGENGLIPLVPVAGEAACADANGRYGLAIFGGPPALDGSLRSTAGGLRLADADIRTLMAGLKEAGTAICEIIECEVLPDYGWVSQHSECHHDDPLVSIDVRIPAQDRNLRAHPWAAGTIALGMAVTFIAIPAPAYASDRLKRSYNTSLIDGVPSQSVMAGIQLADDSAGYAKLAYNPPPANVDTTPAQPDAGGAEIQAPTQPDVVAAEVQSAVEGTPPPEPKTYAEDVREIQKDVIKQMPQEEVGATVTVLQRAADSMADASEAAEWKPAVSVLDNADTEFRVSNYTVASTALEGVDAAFKVKSAYESGNRIGNAINDLQDGKIDVATFVQRVGPEPAKIVLAHTGLPFSDQVVDLTVSSANHGVSSLIDWGFNAYDKYKGYNITPTPGDKK